ncbi:hypothetical protein AAC387_Pa07g2515 [Persea americana]|eukprot:TRINITY_DN3308_c0_g1_i1.p2 TRINITY_DN3308_c0_g1~~TRINITY_DN3308_c0_g1_i1.p2  ORF type:complete len:125 (+),score=28.77 TRINITY_DN3308_c0_g1_i1:107-481(+)
MEKERSRPGNGGKRGRAGGDGGVGPSATEDEVEEFFAILRRIRAASRQICGGRQMTVTEKGARWKPTFEWEDFEGPNGVKTNGEVLEAVKEVDTEKKKKEEDLQGGLELDLNEEPKPEKPAHFS